MEDTQQDRATAGPDAPGAPGMPPTWTSSAKDLVVSTNHGSSRLWATLGAGIVNEVYWPSTGQPQIRDLGFIIGFDDGRWVEVKRAHDYTLTTPSPHVPAANIVHAGAGYRLVLDILPDPQRDALLIAWRMEGGGRLHVLLAPHLGCTGWDNSAWVADGLFARARDHSLYLASDQGFVRASAGYVGTSDGWQDFNRNGRMTWDYPRAERGNVALTGELPGTRGVLALAFSHQIEGARLLARAAIAAGFEAASSLFERNWSAWGKSLRVPDTAPNLARQAQLSAAVLKMHEDRTFPGAVVASLSIPWGNRTNTLGGYHLVWTRDEVEAALGLLALGKVDDAVRILSYIMAAQQPDGSWPQNEFSFGRPFWTGIQLDQVGFPVLFAAKLVELGAIEKSAAVARMVRDAAAFLAREGPLSPQDRWEENAGVSPFTLGVEVAALVAAAGFADVDEAVYLLSLADYWNERIEHWTFVEHGPLSRDGDADGYYVRLAPSTGDAGPDGIVQVRNRLGTSVKAAGMVGLDFLYLVRLGLRRPDDARIKSSLRVADRVLRVETPSGPAYHRYNLDGYGEHQDGSAYDGTGIGRAWPLLAGERGHYEVVAGGDGRPYLDAMANMTGPGGLLPEQVWDSAPIPERRLWPGKPSGSAMPLVWAHAEFVKLLLACDACRPLEMLDAVRARYDGQAPSAGTWHWRRAAPFGRLPSGRDLLIEHTAPFLLHFGVDGWTAIADRDSALLPCGMYGVRIPQAELAGHKTFEFTFYDPVARAWSGQDQRVELNA